MDAIEQSTGIYAAAVALAKCLAPEDLNRAAVLLTQLGTTLGTIAALQAMEEGGDGQEILAGRF
jgi:membrane peptidoglycan carboxypeptidase